MGVSLRGRLPASVPVLDVPEESDRERGFAPHRIALVGGFYPPDEPPFWTYVARDGRGTLRLRQARLYGFTKHGCRAALGAAVQLKRRVCPNGKLFVARVVVTGSWDDPEELIEAWRLEGPEPVRVRYYFD